MVNVKSIDALLPDELPVAAPCMGIRRRQQDSARSIPRPWKTTFVERRLPVLRCPAATYVRAGWHTPGLDGREVRCLRCAARGQEPVRCGRQGYGKILTCGREAYS